MSIVVEELSYTYMQNTSSAFNALRNVSFTVNDGEFVGIIGHTGSGKSTLIQQLNGLMHPTSGRVIVDGYDMNDKKQRVKGRALIGMVFQYPDYQLFDSTVLSDVSFGPRNLGLSEEEITARSREALHLVGLDPDEIGEKSPFELSGGQKRRAALAGIIAMKPKYLVLDEPMAGLDPGGRRDILALIDSLRSELGCAVIMVSHSMDDIAKSAERIIVLNNGEVKQIGTPDEVFAHAEELSEIGLDVPKPMMLAALMRERGVDVPEGIYTEESFISWFECGMFNDITLGQYLPGDSVVHRLDPRTKLALMVAYIVAIFLVKDMASFVLVAIFLVSVTLAAKIPIRYLVKALKPMRIILPFMFFFNLLLVRKGELLFSWWIIKIYDEGLYNAFFVVLRLAFLVVGTSLLTLTTTPIALTDGLERILSPLKIVKFPAHELAMMMTIALRFIPTLVEEADKIKKAQLARGADFESGNVFKRAKAMLPILIPLIVNSFRHANELAMAMESRCYHGGEGRTKMRVLRFHISDLVAALVTAALIAAVVLVQKYLLVLFL